MMCRFLSYFGAPIGLDELLYRPANSLIHQSYDAREREEPLNGDGFGVGWYSGSLPEPAIYVGVRPAWNDRNLRSMAPHIQSGCFFAHVRAASQGGVSETNCHPFSHGRLMFMHNGHIEGFRAIKRRLRERLSDPVYDWLEGSTDSEHVFALFLEHLAAQPPLEQPEQLLDALCATIADLEALITPLGLEDPSFMNFVVTDGTCVIATRYVTPEGGRPPHTLYHSVGKRFTCGPEGSYQLESGKEDELAIVVASEKLTDDPEDWQAIPHNHAVIVRPDLGVQLEAIQPRS